jgi:anti-sigma B factor antagonist
MSSHPQPLDRWPTDDAQLRCDVSRELAGARVRLVGALDLATVPTLDAQLAELRDAAIRHIVLDLSGLEFLDSTGLRCILKLDSEARQDGFSLSLEPGPAAVQRVFDLTRTTDRLPFRAT